MRGKPAPKRPIKPDLKYHSVAITRFINQIMTQGKKTIAQKIVYNTFDILKERTKKDPLDIFDKAIKNVTPVLEVRSRRIGGANYQIPIEVRSERSQALAYRWLIGAAKSRQGKPMAERLADEILDASNMQGEAVKKKQDIHRMAEANRAFAHFA